jgi:hypothetical protein
MSDNDLWYVKTADGDVNRVTLDQLDEAFNAGHIDESVMVLPAGQAAWVKLGALLGLDQPAPAPAPVPATPAAYAPAAYAPAAYTPAPYSLPQSLRPMSLDLSIDLDDDMPFKRKGSRKGVVIGALIGAVAIAGVVFAAAGSFQVGATTASAAIAAPPAAAAPPPAPVVPVPAATTTAAPLPDHGLTDEQKAKLAAADQAREDKAKSKKKARGAGNAWHGAGKGKSQGFTTGGSKFDPLNANL